jgi:predicted CXXCH cytochrome family protein
MVELGILTTYSFEKDGKTMMKKTGMMLVVLAVCICVSSVGAAERKKPTTIQACGQMECHDGFEMKEYLHGPIALGECTVCHKPDDVAKHTFKFARKGNDLCTNCHLEQTAGKNVHKPLMEGECIQCHDPHSSDNEGLLLKDTVAGVCEECHKGVTDHEMLHGPVAVGECSICHNPHSSDEKSLLTVKPDELCVACHETTKNELEKFEFIHEPAKGDCTGCHDPHGADNWKMMKGEAPELCLACHEDIKKRSDTATHKHGAVVEKGGCLKCHTPHASTVKYILKDSPMNLCMTCHSKAQGSEENPVPAFTDLKGKKFMHGPIKEKDCSGCHKTHGSENFRLLAGSYPPVFYSPFAEENYALCFTCHQKTLVWTEKTDDLTDFRNGDVNMHYLHVNKDRRGRTCRACHQTHASNSPKHIRKDVPYGMWDLPLNFKKTETGGSCKPGCHVAKSYDRDKPVNYAVPRLPKKTEEKPASAEGTEQGK